DAVPAADAVLFVKVHDTVRVLHDRTRRRAGFQAPRVGAEHAAVLADQPFEIALGVLVLGEAHHRPGLAAEIAGVVVDADIAADLVAQGHSIPCTRPGRPCSRCTWWCRLAWRPCRCTLRARPAGPW